MIRIKLIGLGNRGLRTLERYRYIPTSKAIFTELVDKDAKRVEMAYRILEEQGRALPAEADALTPQSENDVLLSYICTDWSSHASLAIEEMEAGRDVAIEVPAATTVADCQRLIEAARRTGRRCMMMENCCYDHFHLACMEMARQGLFGTITHLEGAYIHTLGEQGDPTKPWMLQAIEAIPGNAYPTHAYGPMAQLLALDGDGLDASPDAVLSMSSRISRGINTALLRTRKGRTVLLQLDVATPRPYSRMQTICGTEGYAQKYPLPTLLLKGMDEPVTGDEAIRLASRYLQGALGKYWQEGHSMGVTNEMNYTMDCRMVDCLLSGVPFDIEVEQAAEWSSLVELTTPRS